MLKKKFSAPSEFEKRIHLLFFFSFFLLPQCLARSYERPLSQLFFLSPSLFLFFTRRQTPRLHFFSYLTPSSPCLSLSSITLQVRHAASLLVRGLRPGLRRGPAGTAARRGLGQLLEPAAAGRDQRQDPGRDPQRRRRCAVKLRRAT